eukprot:COSAG01_NODE_1054_length_11906_cov_45.857796_6_plen_68_part_00
MAYDCITPAVVCIVIWPTLDSIPEPFVTTCSVPPEGTSGMVMTRSPGGDAADVGLKAALIVVVLSLA